MRNCLVGIGPDGSEQSMWDLDKGDLVIGREVHGTGAVLLPSSVIEVSKRHARIRKGLLGGHVLEDLGSANGTFVNDRRVRKHALREGDEIRIGPFLYRVHLERRRSTATLEMVRGPLKGQRWEINAGTLLVGRGGGATIAMPPEENTVSERHAAFQRSGGKIYVTDLGSKNGTRVNGRRAEKHVLADGDRIQLGEVELKLRIREHGKRWLGMFGG